MMMTIRSKKLLHLLMILHCYYYFCCCCCCCWNVFFVQGLSYRYQVPCPTTSRTNSNNHSKDGSKNNNGAVVWGYTSLRDLNLELENHASQLLSSGVGVEEEQSNEERYIYKLCPNTIFTTTSSTEYNDDNNDSNNNHNNNNKKIDNFQPIVPILSRTLIQCGEYGHSQDECIIQGGTTQVLLLDHENNNNNDYYNNDNNNDHSSATLFVFQGITFRGSQHLSVAALASKTTTRAEFIDCHWRESTGLATILITHGHAVPIPFFHVPDVTFAIDNNHHYYDDDSGSSTATITPRSGTSLTERGSDYHDHNDNVNNNGQAKNIFVRHNEQQQQQQDDTNHHRQEKRQRLLLRRQQQQRQQRHLTSSSSSFLDNYPQTEQSTTTHYHTAAATMSVILKDCTIQDSYFPSKDETDESSSSLPPSSSSSSSLIHVLGDGGQLETYNLLVQNNNLGGCLFAINIQNGGMAKFYDSTFIIDNENNNDDTTMFGSAFLRGMTQTIMELYNTLFIVVQQEQEQEEQNNARDNHDNHDDYNQNYASTDFQNQQQQFSQTNVASASDRKALIVSMDSSIVIVDSMTIQKNNKIQSSLTSTSSSTTTTTTTTTITEPEQDGISATTKSVTASSSSSSNISRNSIQTQIVPMIVIDHSWAKSIQGLCIQDENYEQEENEQEENANNNDNNGTNNINRKKVGNPFIIMDETCWWKDHALDDETNPFWLLEQDSNNDIDATATINNDDNDDENNTCLDGIFVMTSNWKNDASCWDAGTTTDNDNSNNNDDNESSSSSSSNATLTSPCPGSCIRLPQYNYENDNDNEKDTQRHYQCLIEPSSFNNEFDTTTSDTITSGSNSISSRSMMNSFWLQSTHKIFTLWGITTTTTTMILVQFFC